MGICWRDSRQAKKTYAVDSAEMEISNTTKKAPHLSRHSFVEATPTETNPHWRGLWLAERKVCHRVWRRLAALWIEKRGSRRCERMFYEAAWETTGCWRTAGFWGVGLYKLRLKKTKKKQRRASSSRFNSQRIKKPHRSTYYLFFRFVS